MREPLPTEAVRFRRHPGFGFRISDFKPRHRAFTLIELLVVIAIIGVLSSLLLPTLGKCKRKARMIEEVSSAKQLLLAAQLYAEDNSNAVFPGYVRDRNATDDAGQPLSFPVDTRYPWRIIPYLGKSFETIYSGDNRAKLTQLRQMDHAGYVYAVSLYPSLGINSFFIGGNQSDFDAKTANQTFGAGTVILRLNEVKSPSMLMSFVSARSAVSGENANGYFHVKPPYTTARRWAAQWSSGLTPEEWGYVAPRFNERAVSAMLDGHAQTLTIAELQDMRHWCNTADRGDFTLKPTP